MTDEGGERAGLTAFCPARLFDGARWHEGAALLVGGGTVRGIVPRAEVPRGARVEPAGTLAPGFVDLQANGGGGVLFNDDPSVETIRRICAAHARTGTTALLPTLITDTPGRTRAALEAGAAAGDVPGFAGLHLEGPHLSVPRKGAHRADLIRPMTQADLDLLLEARPRLPALMVTVAPESATREQVARLASAGVKVSLGHSDCTLSTALDHARAGASLVTHLFNAMGPLGHREPGLAGAALDHGGFSAGLIADGIHVSPAAIRIALRAKAGPGTVFLVTDAMAGFGTDLPGFMLNGRPVRRRDGRLVLEDGTLAGADIDMAGAIRLLHREGVPLETALAMATAYPARAMGLARGTLAPGARADMVELDDSLRPLRTWIGGEPIA